MTEQKLILVVDDNICNLEMIQEFLLHAGYRVATAQDGLEAITKTRSLHPDLILMDVQMPVMDGLKATRWLKSHEEFKRIPVIAITALELPDDKKRCLEAGADVYVYKPMSLLRLSSSLETWLTIGKPVGSLCMKLLGC